jgi:hypothetical protein
VRSSTDAAWRRELGNKLELDKVRLGATPLAEKLELPVSDLSEKAREQKIPGRSTMDHDKLAATVDTRQP